MFNFLRTKSNDDSMSIINSRLYDQQSFYGAFEHDLRKANDLVVIESPFITMKRLNTLLPILRRLRTRGIQIVINTKPFDEHDPQLKEQSIQAVSELQNIGVKVMMTTGHHRKLAIIDDVLYEGSLNILSQNESCEFMRRIKSPSVVAEMMCFTGAHKWS